MLAFCAFWSWSSQLTEEEMLEMLLDYITRRLVCLNTRVALLPVDFLIPQAHLQIQDDHIPHRIDI